MALSSFMTLLGGAATPASSLLHRKPCICTKTTTAANNGNQKCKMPAFSAHKCLWCKFSRFLLCQA
ncbi:hypothetical protein GBA52_021026 [Prunus armeniaca]|nr:hypothetical protein GBA52_021026 [Prunus armeniaca]